MQTPSCTMSAQKVKENCFLFFFVQLVKLVKPVKLVQLVYFQGRGPSNCVPRSRTSELFGDEDNWSRVVDISGHLPTPLMWWWEEELGRQLGPFWKGGRNLYIAHKSFKSSGETGKKQGKNNFSQTRNEKPRPIADDRISNITSVLFCLVINFELKPNHHNMAISQFIVKSQRNEAIEGLIWEYKLSKHHKKCPRLCMRVCLCTSTRLFHCHSLCLFVGQVKAPHHSDQLSARFVSLFFSFRWHK